MKGLARLSGHGFKALSLSYNQRGLRAADHLTTEPKMLKSARNH